MITTNLPQLVQELNAFGPVIVHDHLDTIDLELSGLISMAALDDLLCDALFVDPLSRELKGDRCIVHLAKRSDLRRASDLERIQEKYCTIYVLHEAA